MRFKALIDDGVRMPDPSILVTLHSLDDRSLAPEGHSSDLRARTHPEPQRHDRLESRAGHDHGQPALGVDSLGYPTEVVVEEIYDPQDWERMGMEQGTPFALATRSSRPARSARTT